MNIVLNRKKFLVDGIFGEMSDDKGQFLFMTLEHAYYGADGKFIPKVAEGTYECVRHPPNRLPYETFMLKDVPPFDGNDVDGILIHVGNYSSDSVGCILLGQQVGHKLPSGNMLMESKKAFEAFMKLQEGSDTFILVVSNA